MFNVAVYGKLKWSYLMKELLENEYSELLNKQAGEKVTVKYLINENIKDDMVKDNDIDEISLGLFAQKYAAKEIDAIIIPKEYYIPYNSLIQSLIKAQINLNDIYNGCRLNEKIHDTYRNMPELVGNLIKPMLSDSYLSYLEYHVTDHCNLNCKYCTHYSPLVKESVFTDFNSFKKDLNKLKEYIEDIGVIRILGGEPLLNEELPKFIEYTRKLYPASIISVVTNGLILDKISDELITAMQKNIAFFHISYYPVLDEKIMDISKFLLDKNIAYTVSPRIDKFNKTQLLEKNPDEDFFYSCFQATCTALSGGKIAACYAPFTTKYFNKAFDKNLPENEGIDLYSENLSTENIKLNLLYPIERCNYCKDAGAYPWEIIGKSSQLLDWI